MSCASGFLITPAVVFWLSTCPFRAIVRRNSDTERLWPLAFSSMIFRSIILHSTDSCSPKRLFGSSSFMFCFLCLTVHCTHLIVSSLTPNRYKYRPWRYECPTSLDVGKHSWLLQFDQPVCTANVIRIVFVLIWGDYLQYYSRLIGACRWRPKKKDHKTTLMSNFTFRCDL